MDFWNLYGKNQLNYLFQHHLRGDVLQLRLDRLAHGCSSLSGVVHWHLNSDFTIELTFIINLFLTTSLVKCLVEADTV